MLKTVNSFLLIVVFTTIVHSQDKLETTALNRITFSRKDTTYQFFVTRQPEKFNVQSEAEYYWFAPDTILTTRGSFNGKLLHGSYKVAYPNKNLKEEGFFDYGQKTGLWKYWDTEGRILNTVTWNKGKRDGLYSEYGPDGKTIKSGIYKDDKIISDNR